MGLLRTGVPTVGAIGLALMGGGAAALEAAVTYQDKVLGYGPIAYWMLAEAAGLVAIDEINSPLQDGTHIGVTLGQPGIGDGNTSPLYDGIIDRTNIYSVTFAGAFDGAEGTMFIWAKMFNAGVWTDASIDVAMHLAVDAAANRIRIDKSIANTLTWLYAAGGVLKTINLGGLNDVDWMPLAITWSATVDEVKAYKDGAQVGVTQNGLGVWVPPLDALRCAIGDRVSHIALNPWNGYLAHGVVWDVALTPAQIADLSTV